MRVEEKSQEEHPRVGDVYVWAGYGGMYICIVAGFRGEEFVRIFVKSLGERWGKDTLSLRTLFVEQTPCPLLGRYVRVRGEGE